MSPVGLGGFKFLELADAFSNRLEIGEHPAQPALRDEIHAASPGFFFHDLDGLTFVGAHEEDRFSRRDGIPYEMTGVKKQINGLMQINNMNAVFFPKNIGLHFGVPAIDLMSKMDACF